MITLITLTYSHSLSYHQHFISEFQSVLACRSFEVATNHHQFIPHPTIPCHPYSYLSILRYHPPPLSMIYCRLTNSTSNQFILIPLSLQSVMAFLSDTPLPLYWGQSLRLKELPSSSTTTTSTTDNKSYFIVFVTSALP